MTKPIDYFTFRCVSTDLPNCATCSRECMVNVDMISSVYKGDSGNAVLLISDTNYLPHPKCNRHRFIETAASFEDTLAILDGTVSDLGNITLTDKDLVEKR